MRDEDVTTNAQDAAVAEDLLCARCGYNLRTLSREGNCPECGEAVAQSLVWRPFGGDPQWMIIVAMGLGLLLLASGLVVWGLQLNRSLDWVELAFALGPGAPKAAVNGDLLRGGDGRGLAMVSLLAHAAGVALVLWPVKGGPFISGWKRIALVGIAGVTLVIGVIVGEGGGHLVGMGRDYHEWLPWLLLVDAVSMVLLNWRIVEIATNGERSRIVLWMWVASGAQLMGMPLMAAAILFDVQRDYWWMPAAMLQWVGAVGASLLCGWLMVALVAAAKKQRSRRFLTGEGEQGRR